MAGVVWGVTALLGGRGDAGASAAGSATETVGPAEESPSTGEVAACAVADLETDLALDPPAPAAGAGSSVRVTVRNTGEGPCLLDAGPADLVASVASGPDAVWTSEHCAEDASEERLLDAGARTVVEVSWDGRRSAAGCPADQPQAGAGSYRVLLEMAGEPLGAEAFTVG